MAINNWLGTATAGSQVDTYTPANPNTGDIYFLTLNKFDGMDIEVSFTVAGTETVAAVTAGLEAAWLASDASTYATAADGTTELTLTAVTAGVGFNVTPSVFDGSGGAAPTMPKVATTANAGPNSWDDPNNWSEGTIPGATAGEDTYIANSSVDILYGLDQSGAANTLTSCHFDQSYTGLVAHNGGTGLVGDYLQLKVTTLLIGENFTFGLPGGSGRIKIDTGATACAATIYNTGPAEDTNKPSCRLIGTSLDITDFRKGTLGLAFGSGETSTIGTILQSFAASVSSDSTLTIGSGVSLTTLNQTGGRCSMQTGATTITAGDGTMIISGSGAVTTLNVSGGSVEPSSTGTITTCSITSGLADFTKSAESRTVTNMKLDPGGTLRYNAETLTLTNNIVPVTATGRKTYIAS